MGFLKKIFKGAKKAVKSITKGVKKAFKSVSKAVGKVFGGKFGSFLLIAAVVAGAIYFGPQLLGGSSALAPGATATGAGGVSSVASMSAAEAAATAGSALSGTGSAGVLGSASQFAGMGGAGTLASTGATAGLGSAGIAAAADAALPTLGAFAGSGAAAAATAPLAGAEILGSADTFVGMGGTGFSQGGGLVSDAMDPWGINQRAADQGGLTDFGADSFSGMQGAETAADPGIYGPYKGSLEVSAGTQGVAPVSEAAMSQAGYIPGATGQAPGLAEAAMNLSGEVVKSGLGFAKENPMVTYLLANTLMRGLGTDPQEEANRLEREKWRRANEFARYPSVRPSGRSLDYNMQDAIERNRPIQPPGGWRPSWMRRG